MFTAPDQHSCCHKLKLPSPNEQQQQKPILDVDALIFTLPSCPDLSERLDACVGSAINRYAEKRAHFLNEAIPLVSRQMLRKDPTLLAVFRRGFHGRFNVTLDTC